MPVRGLRSEEETRVQNRQFFLLSITLLVAGVGMLLLLTSGADPIPPVDPPRVPPEPPPPDTPPPRPTPGSQTVQPPQETGKSIRTPPSDPEKSPPTPPPTHGRPRLTLEEILSRLALAKGRQGHQQILAELVQLFRSDTRAVGRVVELLADGKLDPAQVLVVASVLSGLATPEAQESLILLVGHDSLDAATRRTVLLALGNTKVTTPAVETLLREASGGAHGPELALTGLRALGRMARTLADAEDPRAGELARFLDASYSVEDPLPHQKVVLEAIGRAGDPTSLPTLRRALQSPDEWVRSSALRALRHLPEESSTPVLVGSLSGDDSETVRLAALQILSFRKGEPARAALRGALQDASERVRLGAVRRLARSAATDPATHSALEEVAETDPSERIRNAARAELSSDR